MLKIGITGGIGSGKTTVCKIFKKLGIPVYYADDRAKKLMVEDPEIVEKIKSVFGKRAYHKSGSLYRQHIARIAFSKPEKLKMLNKIVHPAVAKDSMNWLEAQKNVPYTLKEAALLVEAGSYKLMDKLIVVTAPQETRIERVMNRDKTNRTAVEARIAKQMPEKEKLKFADFEIKNDGSESLVQQVWTIHQKLKSIR